jgi:hypothetical protein
VNIVQTDPYLTSKHQPEAPTDFRFFRARGAYYETGAHSERLILPDDYRVTKVQMPGYLHFKFCKNPDSQRAAWPDKWRDMDHFRRIVDRAEPGAPYLWDIPPVLEGLCQR